MRRGLGSRPKSDARRQQKRPRSITPDSLADRGETDAYGNVSEGLGRKKLKYRDLDNDNLGDGAVNDRTISGRLGNQSVPTLPNVEGDLPHEKLPQIAKGKIQAAGTWPKTDLPGDTQYGRPVSNDIEYKDKSIPKRALEAVGWDQVDGKPDLVGRGALDKTDAALRHWARKTFRPK